MIIYGWRIYHSTIDRQSFRCPSCRTQVEGEVKRADKYFTLYFIPLFPIGIPCEFVECTLCGTGYRKEILTEPQLLAEFEPVIDVPLVVDAPPESPSPYRVEVAPEIDEERRIISAGGRTPAKSTSPAAILSLLLGMLAIGTFWSLEFALGSAVTAIVCGHLGLAEVKRRPLKTSGRSLAKAGLGMAYLSALAAGGWMLWTQANAPKPINGGQEARLNTAGMFVADYGGQPTSGNTPVAHRLAAGLGRALDEQHDKVLFMFPRNGRPYRIWCEIHDGGVAFIVGPPDVRRFDAAAVEKMRLNTWHEAYRIACTELKNQGRLGVRMYAYPGSPVMTGRYGDAPVSRPQKVSYESRELIPFF